MVVLFTAGLLPNVFSSLLAEIYHCSSEELMQYFVCFSKTIAYKSSLKCRDVRESGGNFELAMDGCANSSSAGSAGLSQMLLRWY
jgi:hypothetical protein